VRPREDPNAHRCLMTFRVTPHTASLRSLPYGKNDDGTLSWGRAEDFGPYLSGSIIPFLRFGLDPQNLVGTPEELLDWLSSKGHAISRF
jgi:hypothetical protein